MFRKYFFIFIFLVSCEVQESKNIYIPPANIENIETTLMLKNYSNEKIKKIESDIVSIFNLESIELFSNFTLDIKTQDIPKYIDCGQMNGEVYVEYIERIFGSSLKATIDIDLTKDENIYKLNKMLINYLFMSKETGTRWKFKTNSPKELLVGNPVYDANPYRTCMTKNVLEKEIIRIIKDENTKI
jgi:hypothetical protein